MNAIVIKHVPVAELPSVWRDRENMADVQAHVRRLRAPC